MSRGAPQAACALVTGGGSGIGRAVAARLAASGTRVFTASRTPPDAPVPGAVHLPFDAAVPGAAAALLERVRDAGGVPDLVVHGAGSAVFGPAVALDGAAWRCHFAVHVDAARELAAAVLPRLRRDGGTLVLVGSLAAEAPIPNLAAYSAAKAALASFAEALVLEEPRGSRAVVIEFRPGDVRTAFNERMARASPPRADAAAARAWRRLEEHLEAGASADAAAAALLRAVARGRPGVVRFGRASQRWGTRLAALLPSRLRWGVLRRYHDIRV